MTDTIAETSTSPQAANTFFGVQALRAWAALMVVWCHASQVAHYKFGLSEVHFAGASGVDVFFPISGFVMVLTTYHRWGEPGLAPVFFRRRLLRIVPLYWSATLLKALIVLAFPAAVAQRGLDVPHLIASLAFFPAWDHEHALMPLIPVGWTLNLEMAFYVLFAASLALRLKPMWSLSVVLVVAATVPVPADAGVWRFWFAQILVEFAFGMWIAWFTVRGHRLPTALSAPLLVVALALLVATQWLGEAQAFRLRLWVWGIPGALALAAIVSLEPKIRGHLRSWPARLGDASYATYLVHGFALPPVGMLLARANLPPSVAQVACIVIGCIAGQWLGWLAHRHVEQPLTRLLQSRRASPAIIAGR